MQKPGSLRHSVAGDGRVPFRPSGQMHPAAKAVGTTAGQRASLVSAPAPNRFGFAPGRRASVANNENEPAGITQHQPPARPASALGTSSNLPVHAQTSIGRPRASSTAIARPSTALSTHPTNHDDKALVEQLKSELAAKQAIVEDHERSARTIQQENDRLLSQLADQEAATGQQASKLETLQQENSTLQEQLVELEEAVEQANELRWTAVAAVDQERSRSEHALLALRNENEKLSSDVNELRVACQNALEQLEQHHLLKQRFEEAEAVIDSQKQQLLDAAAEIRDASQRAQFDAAQAHAITQQHKRELATMSEANLHLCADRNALALALAILRPHLVEPTVLPDRSAERESSIETAKLRNDIANLKHALQEAESLSWGFEEERDAAMAQVDALNDTVSKLQGELKHTIDSANVEAIDHEGALESLRLEVGQTRTEALLLEDRLECERQDRELAEEQLKLALAAKQSLAAAKAELETEACRLLSAESQVHSPQANDVEIDEVSDQTAAATLLVMRLRSERDDLEQTLEFQLKESRLHIEHLTEALASKDQLIVEIQAHLERLKEAMAAQESRHDIVVRQYTVETERLRNELQEAAEREQKPSDEVQELDDLSLALAQSVHSVKQHAEMAELRQRLVTLQEEVKAQSVTISLLEMSLAATAADEDDDTLDISQTVRREVALQDDLASLRIQVQTLHNQLQDLEDERNALAEQLSDAREKQFSHDSALSVALAGARSRLDDADARIDHLQKEKAALEERVSSLASTQHQESLAPEADTSAISQSFIESLQEDIDRLERDLSEQTRLNEVTQLKLDDTAAELIAAQDKLETMTGRLERAAEVYSTHEQWRETVLAAVDSLQAENESLSTSLANDAARTSQLGIALADSQTQLEHAQTEARHLRATLAASDEYASKVAELESRVLETEEELEAAHQKLRIAIEDSEALQHSLRTDIEVAVANAKTKEQLALALQAQLDQALTSRSAMEQELAQARDAAATAQSRLDHLSRTTDEQFAERAAIYEAKLLDSQNEIGILSKLVQSESAKTSQALSELHEAREQSQLELSRLSAELQKSEGRYAADRANLEEVIGIVEQKEKEEARLHAQIASLEDHVRQLNASLASSAAAPNEEMQQRVKELEKRLAQKMSEVEESDEKYMEVLRSQKRYTAQIERLKVKVDSLQRSLAELRSAQAASGTPRATAFTREDAALQSIGKKRSRPVDLEPSSTQKPRAIIAEAPRADNLADKENAAQDLTRSRPARTPFAPRSDENALLVKQDSVVPLKPAAKSPIKREALAIKPNAAVRVLADPAQQQKEAARVADLRARLAGMKNRPRAAPVV